MAICDNDQYATSCAANQAEIAAHRARKAAIKAALQAARDAEEEGDFD